MRPRSFTAGVIFLLLALSMAGCLHSRISPEAILDAGQIDAATFRFSALDSYDPDGAIVSILWDFGDGATEPGAVRTHKYAQPGEYTVTVEVTDDDGLTAWAETLVTAHREILVPGDYETIQGAIDAASDGDTITLAGQTFAEYFRFTGKAITVRGEGQTETTLGPPPIGAGQEATAIVTFADGETRDAILENLTIQGSPWSFFVGSAIRVSGASPIVRGCIISSHRATFGGAVTIYESGALFESNRFLNNQASVDGGAVNVVGTSKFPDFLGNTFTGNIANAGGAICLRAGDGTAIAESAKLSSIDGNTFTANQLLSSRLATSLAGGAIHVGSGVRVILGSNTFDGNLPSDVLYEDVGL